MRLTVYKPNRANKGSACSFNVYEDGDDSCVYAEIIRQVSWDDKKKTGSFRDGEKVSVKFNWKELCSLKRALGKNREKSFFHAFGDSQTQIFFKKYVKDDEQVGFSFSIKQGDESFYIGFDFDEVAALIEWLDRALDQIYEAEEA